MSEIKICHTSDWHQGYHTGNRKTKQDINAREADGYFALQKLVTDVINSDVKIMIVAGDIFHTPKPEIRTILFVQKQLLRLYQAGVKVYMLAGNHDTNDVKADIAASKILHDPQRGIYSHSEPYVKYEIAPGVWLHMISHHIYAEQADTISLVKPIDGAINILSTHGSCIDPILQLKLKTENSPREIVLPDELLEDHHWDYVMLGHIHERGYPGSTDGINDTQNRKIYYNGSLIRRGFSDKECSLGRGWTQWNIDTSGIFTPIYHTIAQRPQIDFNTIDAKDLTSSEITERMINNLQETQGENGTEFILERAPILRQRIINLDGGKQAALDWNAINHHNSHAFSYTFKPTSIIRSSTTNQSENITLEDLNNNAHSESNNPVSLYDDWVENSETLKNVNKTIRDKVYNETKKFIELGQEITFTEDE